MAQTNTHTHTTLRPGQMGSESHMGMVSGTITHGHGEYGISYGLVSGPWALVTGTNVSSQSK